jgi:hypothetical protein
MNPLNPYKTGLVLAILMAVVHLFWAVLVAAGWGQVLLDFIFWIHHIKPTYVVEHFEVSRALLLVTFTFLSGYCCGAVLAVVWNRLHR